MLVFFILLLILYLLKCVVFNLLISFFKCIFLKQCRQAKISYSGKFMADVCFQYGDGVVIREKFYLGQFPIMLKVS